ncbi:MAG: peptidylprolyl isomerase [Chloroflexi bacterium]|nr:peptidylprolyl isomerase [Chloroflexota bacterium]
MTQAKAGDTVKVHYTGKLDDGTVFDTSNESDPLEFTLGEGQVIPGFEQAVMGMNPGDSKTTKIPADNAYGPHRPEMVLAVERAQFPAHIEPELDQQLQIRQPDGQTFVVRVTDVNESAVTLDANHPLAGQDLTFDIQLVEVTPVAA